MTNNMRNYERRVYTWKEMKSLMNRRFILSRYYKELYQMFVEYESKYKDR